MIWRIYRLPGSRENWHIDAGHGTQPLNVRVYECRVTSHSVDIGGNNVPRAWIEVEESELHLVNGVAVFSPAVVVMETA
jgi:hypothetical protein